jgi:hypothetical protein
MRISKAFLIRMSFIFNTVENWYNVLNAKIQTIWIPSNFDNVKSIKVTEKASKKTI